MKKKMGVILFFLSFVANAASEDVNLNMFLSEFDYSVRNDMKIGNEALIQGIMEEKIQLIDIRFKEEFDTWHMGFAVNIPLNELPKRMSELPKNKLIVTACPHKDRAILGMVYLRTRGVKAKYLKDGLVTLAEYLRGDAAKEFIKTIGHK